jgi:RimJ/RimL family protein N-acetyltransferase
VLRRSFLRNGEYLDQQLWSMLDSDWKGQSSGPRVTIH